MNKMTMTRTSTRYCYLPPERSTIDAIALRPSVVPIKVIKLMIQLYSILICPYINMQIVAAALVNVPKYWPVAVAT